MKVSVCMVTYNHEKYISETIEGVLMQQTNFDVELVIGEDCSTDNTRSILLEYKKKYPDKIRLLLHEKNLGMMSNFIATLQACKGEYIALCDGDDYWIDNLKLQKQVDFLDANKDYSAYFSNVNRIRNNEYFDTFPSIEEVKTFSILDIINDWFISICSLVFRRKSLADLSLLENTKAGDQALCLNVALDGLFFYSPDLMCNYRLHSGGITSKNGIDWTQELIELFINFNILSERKFNKEVEFRLSKLYKSKIKSALKIKHPILKIKNILYLYTQMYKNCPSQII